MASSRWKRFAFFEKQTLSLPPEVLEDLIPAGPDSYGNNNSRRSIRTTAAANHHTRRDFVSLTVTTAALPLHSKPKPSRSSSSSGGTGLLDGGGIENNSNDDSAAPADAQEDVYDAMGAMWLSLEACTSPEISGVDGGFEDNSASVADRRQPTVKIPSQAQVALKGGAEESREQLQSSSPSANNRSSAAAVTDGLVLAFVASRDTELVHCFDLTARCNPPAMSADDERDLDDLGGWAGYFAPFPESTTQQNTAQGSSTMVSTADSVVVGITACRVVTKSHRAVHLACISRSQLRVWEDPHLHLSCRRPLTFPRATPDAVYYSMTNSWNTASDGECQVVDIASGIVAVGTSTGSVLVFVYSPSVDASKRVLRPYLKIPPPPASGMEVVSVKISLGSEKASIFVAYRRETSNGVSQQQMSTAGICCYDMPLPNPATTTTTTLSAPSARHDLDGRYVSSPSLVDAYSSSNNGLQVTVVRCA